MTSTAQWLQSKLGLPCISIESEEADATPEFHNTEAVLIARQRALAAMPLRVLFTDC